MTATSRLVCAACGWTAGTVDVDPYPFRCPRAGTDDGDHVIRREILAAGLPASVPWGLAWNYGEATPKRSPANRLRKGGKPCLAGPNPFLRFRHLLHSWHALQAGLKPCSATDLAAQDFSPALAGEAYIRLVERVDASVQQIAGVGFRETPWGRSDALSRALGLDEAGGVWVKDETINVSGSHKARHLMGVALYLEVLDRVRGSGPPHASPLAIASCGNAALAAAIVARAIERELLVFVPDHASPGVVATLEQLGATVHRCTRIEGVAGDPSYHAFRRALAEGALPFSCQGNQNGLVIEGGSTLGYEIIEAAGERQPDRLFVQVGGGALASACVQAFTDYAGLGRPVALPRIHAVQTRGGYPLKRAYDLVVDHLFARLAEFSPSIRTQFATDDDRARYLATAAAPDFFDQTFADVRQRRSAFMWAWETEPQSVAGGILDDETYDWAVVVEAMVRSGGFPIVADEATLDEANRLARETTGIDVDHTGSAGLAGLLALSRSMNRPRPVERVTVLFTGGRR
jgi:threonine synthase